MIPNLYPLQGPQSRLDSEISLGRVKNFSVNTYINSSRMEGGNYNFYFKNVCYSSTPVPGVLKVDTNILKQKLIDGIRLADRKYIKLTSFDTNNSKFTFDIDEWLKDGLKGCKPYTNFTVFEKSYKLSKALPYMVSVYGLEMQFNKFIVEHFIKYVKTNSELRKNVYGIIENLTDKTFGISAVNMFDYRYDKISNSIIVSIKPALVGGLIATMSTIKGTKKPDFDKMVGKMLNFK